MRRLVSICIFAVWLLPSVAQDMADMEKILKLKGEDSPENLDPYDVERLEGMLAHPLKLNYMSVSRLKESGLFTHYQAVSFVDYRSRHGDVLSMVSGRISLNVSLHLCHWKATLFLARQGVREMCFMN